MSKPISIIVANQKGGVGKTTTSIEIAAALENIGRKVLLIDFDQQGNLTKYVGADPDQPTIYDMLHGKAALADGIQKLKICDVIGASEELSKADKEFVDVDDIYLLADLMEYVPEEYDYVVVDNSPSRNILLTMSYVAADYVIIPTECDDGSLDGIVAIDNDIRKYRDGRTKASHAIIMGLILTKVEKTVMHDIAMENLRELAETIGNEPFVLGVRKSIAASSCKKMGMSIQEFEKYNNAAIDYRTIAKEIVTRAESRG